MSDMNVYDFDKTIFYPDSSATFLKWELRRHPLYLLIWLPAIGYNGLKYLLKLGSKKQFKESLFRVLRCVPDVKADAEEFWDEHLERLCIWYAEKKADSDLIISASPEFLIGPAAKRLGVSYISTRMDYATGEIIGENCFGEEKVRRFFESVPDGEIDEFYSDSLTDEPLARLSKKAFLVINEGQTPVPWPD